MPDASVQDSAVTSRSLPGDDQASRVSLLSTAILAAVGAMLRRPDGTGMLPLWAAAAFQLPVLLVWLSQRCRSRSTGRSEPRGIEPWLTLAVLAGVLTAAILRADPRIFFIGTTIFVVGAILLDSLSRYYKSIDNRIDKPLELFRAVSRHWLLLIAGATLLLSLPLATRSGVPDYAHNFWSHVLDNAVAAVGAACLVGNTIYGFSQEYTRFGQTVLIFTTQLAGVGFCAIGLAIMGPCLPRRIRLKTVLYTAFGLQLCAILVMGFTRSNAVSIGDGLWKGLVHACSALWNSGFLIRDTGSIALHSNRASFVCITALSIVGSLGLPVILDLIRGRTWTGGTNSSNDPPRTELFPLHRLTQFEAAAALLLLVIGACLLFFFETPGALPDAWVPDRPFDLGEHRIALRDETGHADRWRRAVFVSALLRSAGMHAIPISEGSLSWPSCGLVIGWMFIGGSAGGVGGGIRVSAFLLTAICVLYGKRSWADHRGGLEARRFILSRIPLALFGWICIHLAAAVAFTTGTDATIYEAVMETAAAINGVGLTTDLSLHLTPAGRLAMMLLFIVGRWLPVLFWLHLADRIARCLHRG